MVLGVIGPLWCCRLRWVSRQGGSQVGAPHLAGGPALLLFHGVELEARASVAAAMRMHGARLALLIEGVRERLQKLQQGISKKSSAMTAKASGTQGCKMDVSAVLP